MAVHITCGYANIIGTAPGVLGGAAWSETMSSAGVAPQAAPDLAARASDVPIDAALVFQVDADADVWVAIAAKDQPLPDATQASGARNTARWKVRAGQPREFFARAGSRIAWAAA